MSDMADMQLTMPGATRASGASDKSLGRIVSVTGSKAIVLLDGPQGRPAARAAERPEMGTLFAIDTANTVVLAIVSALSVPVPAQREGETEIWIAELGLVGELWQRRDGAGDDLQPRRHRLSLRSATACASPRKAELGAAFCGDPSHSVRVGCIRQDPSIPAMVRVDELLGKHFAILGTTGTGKSCTTALILRSILREATRPRTSCCSIRTTSMRRPSANGPRSSARATCSCPSGSSTSRSSSRC